MTTIIDGKHVEYKFEMMSMNVFGCKVMGWTAIQSYVVMRLVGGSKTLEEMREERMR